MYLDRVHTAFFTTIVVLVKIDVFLLILFLVLALFLGFVAPGVLAKKWKNGVADPTCYQVKNKFILLINFL